MQRDIFKQQLLPIILATVTTLILAAVLFGEVIGINRSISQDILLQVRWYDVVVGMTIYLKTAIDFAIFIGRLMRTYPTWKHRIAIEIGTAAGNALGTMIILLIWSFFKEIRWLLALMIAFAALVLLRLAEDGLEHARPESATYPQWYLRFVAKFEYTLKSLNKYIAPMLNFIVPDLSTKEDVKRGFWPLLIFAFTVPFILGLDDFAGYISLFSVVNVLGFCIGVFLGHLVLNIFLFIKPHTTVSVVRHPIISLLGSMAFVGIGLWGLVEATRVIGW